MLPTKLDVVNVIVTGLFAYGGLLSVKLLSTKKLGELLMPADVRLPISRVPSVVGFCEG